MTDYIDMEEDTEVEIDNEDAPENIEEDLIVNPKKVVGI